MTWINLVEGTENMLRVTKISFLATGKKMNRIQTVIVTIAMVRKR